MVISSTDGGLRGNAILNYTGLILVLFGTLYRPVAVLRHCFRLSLGYRAGWEA